MITEKSNPLTVDIDLKSGKEIALLMNNEDKKVAGAINKILPKIGDAIEQIAEHIANGGKVGYFGAGTSGRIGILDAAEIPPTFGADENLFKAFIAGGNRALLEAVENAEDSTELALADFNDFAPQRNDVIIAISASGNPAYTVEILRLAMSAGIFCIALTSNSDAAFKPYADIFLCTDLGPEVITGSSRLKSGTAQKMILNMLSTGAMIKLGKTYKNYMVDLKINNQKLHKRALHFITQICDIDVKTAENALNIAGNVKTACVMLKKNCSLLEAQKLLHEAGGILRRII